MNEEVFHGPKAGLGLYLKKFALPAVSVEYARNLETGEGIFNANIGFAM
jgi:hypothetical protein